MHESMEGPNAEAARIRRFEWKDIGQVLEIDREAFEKDSWDELEFMRWYENFPEGFLLAENESGGVSGYIICDKEGYVRSIAVRKEERRGGKGRALIKEAIERLELKELYLHVRTSNEKAIKFYENLGFKRIRIFKGV